MGNRAVPIAVGWILLAAAALAQKTPSLAEQTASLDAVREYALNYTSSLPNYTCTQVIKRITNLKVMSTFSAQQDVVEEQLSFVNHREIHKISTINGKPVPPGQTELAGTFSRGEFGNLLEVIFYPATGAQIRWDRMTKRNGMEMYVFSYSVPQGRGYSIIESGGTIRVPFKGLVYVDARTSAVMRIEMECFGIPAGAEYQAVELTLDYKPEMVAGQSYILPAHYSMRFRNVQGIGTNESDFKDYRKFSADAKITFDEDPK